MATPAATVSEYLQYVGRSKLVNDAELKKACDMWAGGENEVEAFRKHLVREKLLTEYQAALIHRGRAEGFVISEYVILDRIGGGASAGVYKALHKSGQVVALKVLPGSKAKEPTVLQRFQREGRLLTQLDHPNVVRAYQIGQAGDVHFIVMEHLEGETLDDVLKARGKLPPAEAARLVYQALHGLQHLHERRMVHRDLKPTNLMLVPPPKGDTLQATLKILDIGIGRELFDETAPVTRDLQLTADGALLGTPDYLAPEQARDARLADVRADIYSLGCVLFHTLAGRPPFQDKNVMALMVKHATEKLPPLPDVPAKLVAVVTAYTQKDPGQRPGTPVKAAELLRPFLPPQMAKAEKVPVLPAYQEWLESESGLEMPAEVKATRPSGAMPPVAARPAAKASTTVKAQAVVKPGTGTAPIAVAARAEPKSPPAPAYVPPPMPAAYAVPAPMPVVNVELADWPQAAAAEEDDDRADDRGLMDMDRRDWIMLALGGGMMLGAIAAGFGLTKVFNAPKPPPAE